MVTGGIYVCAHGTETDRDWTGDPFVRPRPMTAGTGVQVPPGWRCTHPGAAVDEGACDPQHVRVLGELQQVPLQLLLVLGHLAQLHFQPLQLLLNTTRSVSSHSTIHNIDWATDSGPWP